MVFTVREEVPALNGAQYVDGSEQRKEMESLQQESEIVKGVIANLCETLGPDVQEHICRDKLQERARFQIGNSSGVQEAIEAISLSLQCEMKEKLKEEIATRKIRDELERTSKEIIVKQIREELERESELFQQNTPGQTESKFSAQEPHTSCQSQFMGAGEASNSTTSSEKYEQPHKDDRCKADSEDEDVVVLSPVPKQPVPLIVLTDDSCESTSLPTNTEGVSIEKVTESHKKIPKADMDIAGKTSAKCDTVKDITTQQSVHGREYEMGLENGEIIAFTNTNSANLCKDEGTLNKNIKDLRNEGKRNKNTNHVLQRAVLVDNENGHGASDQNASLFFEDNNPRLPDSPEGARLSTSIDGNRNSKVDVINFLMNDQPEGSQSEQLWEDAHFVCSLLPYFTLEDIHQTMVENVHHPNRRSYVLEAYVNIAVDRKEPVQDAVLQGLWAARKRSFGELDNMKTNTQYKKRRTEHEPEANAESRQQITQATFDEALPSTSRAGISPSRVTEPGIAAETHDDMSESIDEDPVKEKWHKEKLDFVCAVLHGVDRELLWAHIISCHNDADIEALVERMMEEQDQVAELAATPVPPYREEDQPSTSAFHPVAVAGPSNVLGIKDDDGRDESVAGPSSEEAVAGEEDQRIEDRVLAQVKTLSEMFADADPDYLQQRCVVNQGDETSFQAVVNELIVSKSYPKIEEYHKRQKRLEIKKKFIEGMSVEEFLEYFEDPEKVFCDTSTAMSLVYVENARTQLKRDFPFHLFRDIESTLRKYNYHYLPSLRALQANENLTRRKSKRTSKLKERDLDDIFIKELCYARMQEEIKEHLWKKSEEKRRSFLQAKATDQLQECRCCCDDEILEEDMEPCSSQDTLPHKFCVNCIRRFVEEEIGQGRTSFRCLEGECQAEFSLATLKRVMKPSVFSNILERKQQEEIAAAGIEDLVACPFCNFQTIMPNPEDKVFKCLNPECMKDSCRYCKEPNHVPLRCEEVEKQNQRDTRVFLENKMTEAMVRECWKCKKRFIKEDGCNKMLCSCGAMMCYICKKPIKGYNHFEDKPNPTDSRKCPLWSNSKVIHAEEVRDAALKLREELDPTVDLLHNPLEDLPEVPQNIPKQQEGQPVQLPHAPPAHQHLAQAHLPLLHHHHLPHVVHVRRGQAIFDFPAPPPPPAHRQLPPALPAHQHLPGLGLRMMRPAAAAVVVAEDNLYQHHHHHHFHHHHIRPLRQEPPPVHIEANQHLRDNTGVQLNEILMEMRNHNIAVRDGRPHWGTVNQIPGGYNQEHQHQEHHQQQQQQQTQHQQGLRHPYGR